MTHLEFFGWSASVAAVAMFIMFVVSGLRDVPIRSRTFLIPIIVAPILVWWMSLK